MASPQISVVVPFLGSEREARAALRALRALSTGPDDEVILVDNTPEHVLGGIDAGPVRVLAAPERQTAFFARNAGARRASGEWLLFLDADCRPPENLLERFFDPPPADTVAIVAGELVGDEDQDAIAARWARSRRGRIASHHLDPGPFPAGVTANMLIRRLAFESVGGFEDRVRSDADVELCWRLQEAGWGFLYRPEALVVHRDPERIPAIVRQAVGYGAGRRWTNHLWPGSGSRPPVLLPILRAVGGGLAWMARGQLERAAFKLLDGLAAVAGWWGYLAVPNAVGETDPGSDGSAGAR